MQPDENISNSDHDSLLVLLDTHSERIDVEYKNWIDITDSLCKAKIAKHLCALSNSGGGYIVFGKDDDGKFSEPYPPKLDTWSHDALNSIIKAYLDPVFECRVYHVVSSIERKAYPIAVVPPHGTSPVCSKKDGPQDTRGRPQGIHQGMHYVRAPGPESVPVNTSELWRQIIHRCVINERTSLLASISRLFDRPIEISTISKLDEFADETIGMWNAANFSDRQHVDPKINYCAFGFRFEGADGSPAKFAGNLHEFKRLVEETATAAANAGDIGWGLFDIHETGFRPTVSVSGSIEGYQALMTIRDNSSALNAPAIWRMFPDGCGCEVRGYHEDSGWLISAVEERRGRGAWEAGKHFSPRLQQRRMFQFIYFVYQMSQRFESVTKIEMLAEFSGLAGRSIKDISAGVYYSADYTSAESKRRVRIESSPEALASHEGKAEAAARLIAPIGRLFNGWEISSQAIISTLKERSR